MVPTAIISAGLMAVGGVVAGLGAYQLGLARAARKWDSADRSFWIGRGMATVGALLGLLMLAVGAATLTTLVDLPDATPTARAGLGIAGGVLTFAVGMYGTAKLADRVELNTLIRTPSRFRRLPPAESRSPAGAANPEPPSDPVVPPTARPGWVYRDAGGAWYLVVSAGAGCRLVSMPDFRLVSIGTVKEPVTAAGSVELAVWPLSEAPGVRESEAHQAAT